MTDTNYIKMAMDYRSSIDALMGTKEYADTVLINGQVINVITREIYNADIAIKHEYILLVGDCKDLIGPETQVIDIQGKYLSPGFMDSHMHFESSMLTITEFSRLSIPSDRKSVV